MKAAVIVALWNDVETYGWPCVSSVWAVDAYTEIIAIDNRAPIIGDTEPRYGRPVTTSAIHWLTAPRENHYGGLTGAWNVGLAMAHTMGCDVACLLNDDTIVDQSFGGLLNQAHANDGGMFAYGPLTNRTLSPLQMHTRDRRALGDRLDSFADHPYRDLNGFCLAASMATFRANMFDDRHYFDPAYPFAGNENEWQERLREKGGSCFVVPSCFVWHYNLGSWRKDR